MVDNNNRMKIGVLFGGRSGEHEVSLNSARSVLRALNSHKYDVVQIGITREGTWLVGENLLAQMMGNNYGEKLQKMTPVTILPDPNQRGLYAIHSAPIPVLLCRRCTRGASSWVSATRLG